MDTKAKVLENMYTNVLGEAVICAHLLNLANRGIELMKKSESISNYTTQIAYQRG
jgi:hypothetical protein